MRVVALSVAIVQRLQMLDRGVFTGIAATTGRPKSGARVVAALLEGLGSSRQVLGLAPGAAEAYVAGDGHHFWLKSEDRARGAGVAAYAVPAEEEAAAAAAVPPAAARAASVPQEAGAAWAAGAAGAAGC